MKNKKIDYREIPPLREQDFRRGRRITIEERATYAKAYRNTFHKEPPRIGRPFKYANTKLKAISIRLHPTVLRWAKREAHKRHAGYQSFLNDFLLRYANS
jgi:uncharacterized protein (DUF4415 family)